MKLKFNDGMEFDTSGEYRIVRKPDGLYVVGHGFMCAVETYEEGEELIVRMEARRTVK